MALVSPGVEVTIIDQSQYLPAPPASVPFFLVATAQNKADPTGLAVASATTAANANKLYTVTSQRDLVTLYGTPFFYTTADGTPIQGYELNEYGLLAAYSALGISNQVYVLRADIDLASLVGQTGRPSAAPANNTYWLDTTNTTWGIYEWNKTTGAFTNKVPIVITDSTDLSGSAPAASIGSIYDYAVVSIPDYGSPTASTSPEYFYKTSSGTWVSLGSRSWLEAWPTVQGGTTTGTLTASNTFTINVSGKYTITVTIPATPTLQEVADEINNLNLPDISAAIVSGKFVIYSSQLSGDITDTLYLTLANGTGTPLAALGLTAGTYNQPELFYGTSAQQPLWSASQTEPRPTGSVWLKMGSAGAGFNPVMSVYSTTTASFVPKSLTSSTGDLAVTASLDSTGGQAIPANTVYAQYNFNDLWNQGPIYFWKRIATGQTVVTGTNTDPDFTAGPYTASIYVSSPGSTSWSSPYSFSLADNSDAQDFVDAWAAAGVPYTEATVLTTGEIQITHTEGGMIMVDDTSNGVSSGLMLEAGFEIGVTDGVKYGDFIGYAGVFGDDSVSPAGGTGFTLTIDNSNGIYNLGAIGAAGTGYSVNNLITFNGVTLNGATPGNNLVVKVTSVNGSGGVTGVAYYSGTPISAYMPLLSNWYEFTYTVNEGAPVADPANNTNWYYSVVDQVDIMVNTSGGWSGYRNEEYDSDGFPIPSGTPATDPNGPIISATEPTLQSDGTALVYGDLWIDTSDLENYPVINRWQSVNGINQWVLINNTDQTSSTGVLFADARWSSDQDSIDPVNDPIPTIVSLLTSDNIDLDCPDNTLYPVGMLLFNTRRSGFNVKQFRSNYFNSTTFPDETLPTYTDTWVSVSGLMSNGAPYMGRKAQRAMVVQSLKSSIDTNLTIRDEDTFFNIMATPNYPELQPNMVVLNADRGDTGFIVGDTPMRLVDSATAINAWATNAAGVISTGEEGLVTRNTYMGLFYPSGLTNDLSGNDVVVPPSHMMVRTLLRNDTIAFPWFAPAGTRRGLIDNALSIGYIDPTTGEYVSTRTRVGIRDVLYTNFINPLVFFTGNGLLNYGNKSSFNSSSALDRINVARLVAYLRRQLTLAARPFIFEPNDAFTRGQVSTVIETLLNDLVTNRGIYDYSVVCDESNNTPTRIDRNELWVDVAIQPVKAIEFIYIPVRILNTGEAVAGTGI